MSAVSIENGKRVGELLEITKVSNSAYFLVDVNDLSRKISITSLRNAFNGDSATNNRSNLYYSCEKIDEFIETIDDNIQRIKSDISKINNRMDDIYTNFGSNLSELRSLVERYHTELVTKDEEITTYFENVTNNLNIKINQEIDDRKQAIIDAKTELNATIKNLDTRLTNAINTEIDNREKAVSDEAAARAAADNALGDRITTEVSRLDTRINNLTQTVTNNLNDANKKFTVINNILNGVAKFRIGTSVPSNLGDNEIYFQYFN